MNYLFVIDYQNDFVDGALGFSGAEKLDNKIAAKILEYGKGKVFYTMDTHKENYLETREGRALPVSHCIENSDGWQVYGETSLALAQVDAVMIKKASFGLNPIIEGKDLPENAEKIEIVGLVSNICVVSNAVVLQSIYPNAEIIVDASLTDSFNKELNNKVLDVLEGLQVKVINRKV